MERYNNNIPNNLLKALVYAYCENPETNFSSVDEMQIKAQTRAVVNKQGKEKIKEKHLQFINGIDMSKEINTG